MLIEVGNVHAKILQASEDERAWLSEYLSFPDEKAKFVGRKVPVWKRGDGKVHMLSEMTGTFPSGFIEIVKKAAADDSITIKVVDRRKRPVKADPKALTDWLRDYQSEAIDVARKVERGVFHHVTGAGKTEVMVALADLYPCRWLILTHKKDLLAQTINRFAIRTGEVVGQIGEGVFAPQRVTVGMFNTIHARLKKRDKAMIAYLKTVQGIMVDECHVAPAATFWRVIMSLEHAFYRYGFSGTPFARSDKKSIFTWGSIGPIIHRVPAQRLIEAGVLARPKIRMLPIADAVLQKTWTEAYEEAIVQNPRRNALVLAAAQKATKPCLLFVNHVKHGKIIEGRLRAGGTKVEFVWGSAKLAVRQAAIRRLVHGDTDVLVCNVIFQEGIDIPELQSVVIAQGGKSIIAALQRVGRGTRRTARNGQVTKEEFEVYDINDKGCPCRGKLEHMGCRWMRKHSRGRRAAYASEKYEVIEDPSLAGLALTVRGVT